MNRDPTIGVVLLLGFAVVGAILGILFLPFLDFAPLPPEMATAKPAKKSAGPPVLTRANFLPPRPQEAPPTIRESVMLGYKIVIHTRTFLPGHVGAELDCRSCHFEGGLTDGGRNDGISLVGAVAVYPRLDLSRGRPIHLATRINDCLQRSLNGKPLAHDSREMAALVSYCQWISQGVPTYTTVPWLGLEKLDTPHRPDLDEGAVVHRRFCAVCHGEHGQGTEIAPPQWGPEAFASASALHRLETLSAFVHANMPRHNPILGPEQATDVAAFLLSRPHPDLETP